MPLDARIFSRSNWLLRVRQWPICVQLIKSLEWKMGTPGKNSKEEVTR